MKTTRPPARPSVRDAFAAARADLAAALV